MGAKSLNHWIAREVPGVFFFKKGQSFGIEGVGMGVGEDTLKKGKEEYKVRVGALGVRNI